MQNQVIATTGDSHFTTGHSDFSRLNRAFWLALVIEILLIAFLLWWLTSVPVPEEEQPLPPITLTLPPPPPEPKPVPIEPPAPTPVPPVKVQEKPRPTPRPQPAKVKPAPVPRAQPKPQPTPAPALPTARERAQQSGLLAAKDQLAALRDVDVSSRFKSDQALMNGDTDQPQTARNPSNLTASLTKGSGGIGTSSNATTASGSLAGRQTARIGRPGGTASGAESGSPTGTGRGALSGRSWPSIQAVFDRNKGILYALYNRARRQDPSLQGRVVVRLTIAPSGQVTAISVVSSDLKDASLDQQIISRVRIFNFGKEDVSPTTVNYPLDFVPS